MITDLVAHIRANTSATIYPMIMPTDCVKPAMTYNIVNDRDNQGISGCVSSKEVLIQIDVYGKTYKEVTELLTEVKGALYSFTSYPMRLNSRDLFEADTELFRKLISFSMRDLGN